MYQPIDSLQLPENKIRELRTSGYYYCKDVDIDIPQWNILTKVPVTKTALEMYNEKLEIHTLNEGLDYALGGGIPIATITEFCGEPGSGKTQMCFQLCVSVQLPSWCGGLGGEAIYISTNQGFASHRIREIARVVVNRCTLFKAKHSSKYSAPFDVESIMKRISFIAIEDHVQLLATVEYMKEWLKDHPLVRVVAVDSISAPLKLLSGKERTVVIHNFFKHLQKLAQEYKFAIVVTNDMTTRISSAGNSYQTPSLGGSYFHRINSRIELIKKSPSVFKALILKNVLKPQTEVEFSLIL